MRQLKRVIYILLLSFACSDPVYADDRASADFVVQDMAGKTHKLSSYQGKWVLVNYWATWCPPCLEEVPDLVNLYDKHYQKDLVVLGVVFDYKDVQEVRQYVDDMLMSYPIVLGNDKVKQQIGASEVLPTTFIYNPQGKLYKIKRGIITKDWVETLIKSKK